MSDDRWNDFDNPELASIFAALCKALAAQPGPEAAAVEFVDGEHQFTYRLERGPAVVAEPAAPVAAPPAQRPATERSWKCADPRCGHIREEDSNYCAAHRPALDPAIVEGMRDPGDFVEQ